MNPNQDSPDSGVASRGMATVAILKLNFDSGRDHISMFEPFVLDTISREESDKFDLETLRADLLARHQLSVPLPTLRTLLARISRQGYLKLRDGRYQRTDKAIKLDDLRLRREQVEGRQRRLAANLQTYAAKRGVRLETPEDALALILGFLEQYHVSLALGDVSRAGPRVPTEDIDIEPVDRPTLVVAEFIQNAVFQDGEDAEILQEFIEGFVLHNALLLKDISLAGRRYQNLHVVCDSRLLFAALGVRGEAEEIAVKEFLSLLRQTGAVTDVFEPTIAEMRRILRVYEEKIGTSAGRLELYPTDMTRYFITKRFSPSDLRSFAALLERNLKGLGFNLREIPAHEAHLTLDEASLAKRLASGGGATGDREPRVIHDIACVAGVITMRGGRRATTLETAGAIFATASPLTITTVTDWYRKQGKSDTPPIIHYLALSNHAWLKKPASAARLKVHEVVALCSAALRPSRQAWDVFLRYLRKLQDSGQLTSDEVTAILVSELTDHVLLEDEIDEDSAPDTLSEAVERVKDSYRGVDSKRAAEGEEQARSANAKVLQMRNTLERRARTVASALCWAATLAIAGALFAGAAFTVAGLRTGKAPSGVRFAFAALLVLGGLLSLIWGFNLNGWRKSVEENLTRRLGSWLSGEAAAKVERPEEYG